MEITAEYLQKLKASAEALQMKAATTLRQAEGAIAMLDTLLKRLEEEPAPQEPTKQ